MTENLDISPQEILTKVDAGNELTPYELSELVDKFGKNTYTDTTYDNGVVETHIQSIIQLEDRFFAINYEYYFDDNKYCFSTQPYEVIKVESENQDEVWKPVQIYTGDEVFINLEEYAQEVLEKITNNKNLCDEELELIIECFEVDSEVMREYRTEADGYSIIKLKDRFFRIDYYYSNGCITYDLPFYEVVKRVETSQVTYWGRV